MKHKDNDPSLSNSDFNKQSTAVSTQPLEKGSKLIIPLVNGTHHGDRNPKALSNKLRGWRAPEGMPYVPIGYF